jgi:hypothetical protein
LHIFYFTKALICFSNSSYAKSLALLIQSSFIVRATFGVKYSTAFIISLTAHHSVINTPVFQSITVSLIPHSSTQITGFHAAIDSTGTIPKSSLIGIQIQAIDFQI